MPRTIPAASLAALNAETTTSAFLTCLEVTHSQFATIRLVNNTEDITSGGNVYTAFPFLPTLPPDTDQTNISARVIVQNATRLLVTEVRTISGLRERAKVTLFIVDSQDFDTPLMTVPDLDLVSVEYGADEMVFSLSHDNLLTEPVPAHAFTPGYFPAGF